jgi:FkbM family methyltransferase
MSFISYAQNFEDVMLWRALKHVTNGFYVDVGASDPTTDSITKAFYERGWRGINIEPLPSHYRDLQAQRPRDINLCCAAGDTSGEVDLFESTIRGWATAEKSVADKQIQEGYGGVYHRVPMRTLSDICRECVSGEIHFLKIDVEGLEKQVIGGANLQEPRPWIVVVEATRPNSTEETYEQWESLLLAANYRFAYADGLNRFYVASEHADLLPALKYPPNVFDGFTLSTQWQAEVRATAAEEKTQLAESTRQLAETRAELAETRAERAETRAECAETRTGLAETRAERAETRGELAETRAERAETRGERAEARAECAEARAECAETRTGLAETRAQRAETRGERAEARAERAEARAECAEAKAECAETRREHAELSLYAVYASRSWRLSAPLRWLGRQTRQLQLQRLSARVKPSAKRGAKFVLRPCVRLVDAFPALRRASAFLARKAGVYAPLHAIYRRLSCQRNVRTALNLDLMPTDGKGTSASGSLPGTIVHALGGWLK